MNRDELLDTLAYLVDRYEETGGFIGVSQSEAARILELYDRGEIQEDDLPLPLAAAVAGRRAQLLTEAIRQVRQSGVLSDAPDGPSRTVPIDQRRRFVVAVMEDFDGDVFDDARAVIEGDMDANEWHERMLGRVRRDLLQQARLGKGGSLTADELGDLQDVMDDQAERLKRFADEIATRNELAENAETAARRQLQEEGEEVTEEAVEELAEEFRARKMTTDQVAARSRMYKGRGYQKFWEFNEQDAGEDVVVDYIAVDDPSTCSPCKAAEAGSPYLPGQGPMPGSICLGGGHCRCERSRRVDAEAAAQLRGE